MTHNTPTKTPTVLLLSVDYQDRTRRYWRESIKNKTATTQDGESVHQCIARTLKMDGVELAYNGKPQGNIYRDRANGPSERIGYLYRGSFEVFNDESRTWETARVNIWVTVRQVRPLDIEDIDHLD